MRLSSLKYLTKEGLRSIWSHRLMSIASVIVLMSCLILMGLASLLSVNVNRGLEAVEDKNVINIYLWNSVERDKLPGVESKLRAIENIKEFTFVSKEDAWKAQLEALGDPSLFEGLNIDEDNILPDSFKVVLKDISYYNETLAALKAIPEVEETRDNSDLAEKLTSLRRLVTILGGVLIAMLLVVSLFIIENTIKLTMYGRRLEISIMKAVGATNGFIRFPFIIEGFVLGLFSGAISFGLVWGAYELAGSAINKIIQITPVAFTDIAAPMALGFIVVGVATGVVGSLISMGRYLRKEGSEISAI